MRRIFRSTTEPKREDRSFENLWRKEDKGLITSWEVGREIKEKEPELSVKALRDELPILGFKGGVNKTKQLLHKYGSLNYLAQWQALRGEDLDVDLDEEVVKVCSATGNKVTFTGNIEKLKEA